MVKSTQKKFVIFTAIILLFILSVIFIGVCVIQQRATTHHISISLHNTQIYYENNHDGTPTPDGLYAKFSLGANDQKPYIEQSVCDQKSFSGIDFENLLVKIARECESSTTGNIDNFYFSADVSSSDYTIYVFNATSLLNIKEKNLIGALIFLSVLYVILVLVVWWLSFIVFKPIADNFDKQKQFISDASHELKTPLSIINASADVMANERKSKWIENIKSQTDRMNVLITDMLSLAKLEEGKVTITKQPFDLSEVIMECALPFEAMVFENKKNIEYMVAPNVKANTDKNSVKMLINILLDNAVKYASENGKIIVYLNRVKNKTIFSIYNTGSNVPNKDSARIFERFYRADSSRSRDSGGSGLGLAIAKNLANRNKWKIYADSKQGESMTITVLF